MNESAYPAATTASGHRGEPVVLLTGLSFGADPGSFRLVARDFGPPVLEIEDGRNAGACPIETAADLGGALLGLVGLG